MAPILTTMLLLGCSGPPASEEEAVARVDRIDTSCAVEDPILLADLFQSSSRNWIKVEPADLVDAEIGRESHPQDQVIVDLPSIELEVIEVQSKDEEVVLSNPITVREDKFQGLETVAAFGGPLYVSLSKQGQNRPSSTRAFVWIDSARDVHFLGDCLPELWTEPFGRFADDIGWMETEEDLLLALIHGGPELAALKDWTWPP